MNKLLRSLCYALVVFLCSCQPDEVIIPFSCDPMNLQIEHFDPYSDNSELSLSWEASSPSYLLHIEDKNGVTEFYSDQESISIYGFDFEDGEDYSFVIHAECDGVYQQGAAIGIQMADEPNSLSALVTGVSVEMDAHSIRVDWMPVLEVGDISYQIELKGDGDFLMEQTLPATSSSATFERVDGVVDYLVQIMVSGDVAAACQIHRMCIVGIDDIAGFPCDDFLTNPIYQHAALYRCELHELNAGKEQMYKCHCPDWDRACL